MTTIADVRYNITANTRGLKAAQQQLQRFAQTAERAGKQVNSLSRQNLAGSLQRQGQAAQRSAQQTSRLAQQTARVAAQMRSGNSQVDALVRGLTSTDKATQRAARSQKTLLSTLGGSNRAVAQQAQALARLSQAQAQGVVTARQASEQQRLIGQRFTTTAVNSRDLRMNMRGLNASMDQLATVAAAAGGPVGQVGAQLGMLGGALRSVNPLFAAGAAALAGGGGIATAANRAAQQIDQLNNRAQASGMAVEQYDALVYTFTQLAGVTENEANGALRRYSRRVGDARDGTGRLADELKAAGVRVEDFVRQSPEKQMQTLARAMSDVGDAQQRASLSAAAFGAENVQLGLAFSQGEGALTSYMDKAERLGLVNEDQAEIAGEVLEAQDELRRSVRSLSFTLMEEFGPALANAADRLRGFLTTMGSVAELSQLINDRMQHMDPEFGLPVNHLQAVAETIEDAEKRIAAAQEEMDGGVGQRRMTQLEAIIRQENAELERAAEHRERLLEAQTPESVLTQRFIFTEWDQAAGAPGAGGGGGEGGGEADPAAQMVQRLEDQNAVLRRQQQLQNASEQQRKVAVAVLEAEQELRREGVDLSSEQAQRALELTAQVERQRFAHEQATEAQREQAREAERQERMQERRAQRMDQLLQRQQNSIQLTQTQLGLLGESDEARERELAQLRARQQLQQQGIAATSEQGQAYLRNARQLVEMDQQLQRQTSTLDLIETQAQSVFERFTEGLRDGESGWVAFREAALDAIQEVINELFRLMVVEQAVRSIGSNLTSNNGGFQGVAASVNMQQSAKGNAFNSNGLMAFAKGGVVNTPTVFPFANGTGLMGEAGPEAILPLTRGSGGDLGVKAEGIGGGDQIVEINDMRRGGQAIEAQEDRNENGERRIRLFVRDEVKRMFGEGRADRTMQENYGQKRRPTKRTG